MIQNISDVRGYDIHIVYYYIVSEARSIANYSWYIYQVKSCFELLQYGCKMVFLCFGLYGLYECYK